MTILRENTDAYHLGLPETIGTALVFASPHSGRDYSKAFRNMSILGEHALRSSEDAYVDLLLEALPQIGAPLICASAPRAFVDLNRAPEELDPALIAGARSRGLNPRITSGLGVIPRVVAHSQPIYRGKLSLQDAEQRIAEYWTPYHTKLTELLERTRTLWGYSVLLDMHSMPHEAVSQIRPTSKRPDIIIGDRFGASASQPIVLELEQALMAEGFKVARNAPFAGAYITQRYGRPSSHQHAIQIEIDRSLYLDEARIEPSGQFEDVKSRLTRAFRTLIEAHGDLTSLAAE